MKQNHFRASLKSIEELEVDYSKMDGPKISKPFFKDHYHKKLKRFDLDSSEEREVEIGEEIGKGEMEVGDEEMDEEGDELHSEGQEGS